MEKLRRIVFVSLTGDPPVGQALDPLPDPQAVAEVVRTAFSPFLAEDGGFEVLYEGGSVVPPQAGLIVVYAFGHAWLGPEGPQTSSRTGDGALLEDARNLLARLVPATAADRTILILDCCHASAFDRFITPPHVPRLAVYASGAEEKAITLTGEQASRLSLAFSEKLAGKGGTVDFVRKVGEIAEALDADGVLRGQAVSYRMNGSMIILGRSEVKAGRRRERTVAVIRNVLLVAGAVVAGALITLAWYYRTHALIEIDLAGLTEIAEGIRLVASEEDPPRNGSRIIVDQAVAASRVRLWLPASDVIVRIKAGYKDNAERALGFHLNLQPGFAPEAKAITLTLPSAEEVRAHPRMAFIPAAGWFHGREREARTSTRPFWIDIQPPTVAEYLEIAEGLMEEGKLQREDSYILTARQVSSAVDNVGLGQLKTLNKDLGAILGVIEAANSPEVTAPGDIAVGLGDLPCDTCPAPMTRQEAELYCASRHMRLPTDLEWELAVRGVDGRVYPWGNQFDEQRANVPGLPGKGDPSPALKPVAAYPDERSPFGLRDTVGNAGDWVVNESGPYERVYMGATYSFNQEDATAFRLLPVTDEDSLVREITARCVAGNPVPARR